MMRWLRYLPSPPRVMINEKLDHGGMLIQPAWQVGTGPWGNADSTSMAGRTGQMMGQSGKGEVCRCRHGTGRFLSMQCVGTVDAASFPDIPDDNSELCCSQEGIVSAISNMLRE